MGSAGWARPTPTTSPRGSSAFVGRARGIKGAAVGAAHWQKNTAADERLAGKRGCRRVVARKRGCRRGESSLPVVSCQRRTARGRIFQLPTSGWQKAAIGVGLCEREMRHPVPGTRLAADGRISGKSWAPRTAKAQLRAFWPSTTFHYPSWYQKDVVFLVPTPCARPAELTAPHA